MKTMEMKSPPARFSAAAEFVDVKRALKCEHFVVRDDRRALVAFDIKYLEDLESWRRDFETWRAAEGAAVRCGNQEAAKLCASMADDSAAMIMNSIEVVLLYSQQAMPEAPDF